MKPPTYGRGTTLYSKATGKPFTVTVDYYHGDRLIFVLSDAGLRQDFAPERLQETPDFGGPA